MEPIDEMLAGLGVARQTMNQQVNKLNDILEKSNNILLHIETKSALKAPAQPIPGQAAYLYSSETEHALVRILESFQQMMQQINNENLTANNHSSVDACIAYRKRVEYLGSSVRKLHALNNAVQQMKLNLEKAEAKSSEDDDDDDGDEKENEVDL